MDRYGNYQYFDKDRADNFLNGVCLSVSFPNSKMFYTYRKKYPQINWVVLTISSKVLYEKNCLFFPSNAACGFYRQYEQTVFESHEIFAAMFADEVYSKKGILLRRINLLAHHPTDVQAEVICLEGIEPDYIKFCVFDNMDHMHRFQSNYYTLNCILANQDFDFFNQRIVGE